MSLPFRLPLAALFAVLVSVAAASPARADVLAISAVVDHVAPGGTLQVVVTPDAASDDMTFHGARLFVTRPGRPCPPVDTSPRQNEILGTEATGPFSVADPPMLVEIPIPKNAPSGPVQLCSQWWPIASSLAGAAVEGPRQDIRIDPVAVATAPHCAVSPSGRRTGRCAVSVWVGGVIARPRPALVRRT